ncbi:O-antigen ligase family protein, partial [Patescibacteria group bacterium]|nr:O-antigen ligase family protein [Patescibacteria group bacterium]
LISQLVLLAVVGLILWPLMQNRLGVQDKDGDMALSNRLHYNQEATEMIIASPFLGVGLGNSVPTLMNESPDQETWQYQPVHNLYLLVTTEIGLLGFFIFALILIIVSRNVLEIPLCKGKNMNILLLSGLLLGTLLIVACFDHYFWTINQSFFLFWIVLGLLLASSRMERERY